MSQSKLVALCLPVSQHVPADDILIVIGQLLASLIMLTFCRDENKWYLDDRIYSYLDDDTAAVADISDNGTVDYDEDEADDYDDDAVDKNGHFVCTEPDILPGGKSLPLGRFLETEKVIEILQRTSVNDTLSEVPRVKKDDVYFVVQNENNKDRRAQGKRSQFWDARGAWECNSTSRSYFLQENEKLR
ncbi:hypothetical protein PoB_002077100 [Plakobranchus ocellatus]|uniref:Uncharacterized protein n=1 Tax=Plakobranchus ocellatus TaxID=259542 RepID=A0AAV3Z4P6_9GAST|nr:hypothetical protein PoB_002077100 [Plakobranchus ocellatus]